MSCGLYDPVVGRELRTHEEEVAACREEAAARRAAEARLAELEALLSSRGVAVPPEKQYP